ncbi:MAG: hypothetical protein KAJ47_04250, partial [Candidatus Aenigmarchaeota archaeon]|nr:hypothetical protein [Candidatus Aenigmarchaeota archaeon]
GKYHANFTLDYSYNRGYWNLTYNSSKQYYHNSTGTFTNIFYFNTYAHSNVSSLTPFQIDRDSGRYQTVNISINASDADSPYLDFTLNLTNITIITDQLSVYEINLADCTRYDTDKEIYNGFCLWNPPNGMSDAELGLIDINLTVSDSRMNSSDIFYDQFEVNDIDVIYNETVFEGIYYSFQNIDPSAFIHFRSNSSDVMSGEGDFEIRNISDDIVSSATATITDGFAATTLNLGCINNEEQWYFNASMNTSNLHEDNASEPDLKFNVSRLLTEVYCSTSANTTAFIFDCWYTDTINMINISDAQTEIIANVSGSEDQCNDVQTFEWNATTQTYRYYCEYSESSCVYVSLDVNASRICYMNATTTTELNAWDGVNMDTDLTLSRPSVYTIMPSQIVYTINPLNNIENVWLSISNSTYSSTSTYPGWE